MGDWSKIATSIGNVKPWVRSAAIEIVTACPWQIHFVWGYPGRGTGDHARGLALDLMNYAFGGGVDSPGAERRYVQDWVKSYVMKHRVRLGLDGESAYIIADRQIASDESDPDWTWRSYTGDDPHTNHTHLSFKSVHTYHPPPVEDDMASSDAILAAVKAVGDAIVALDAKNQRRYESLLRKADLIEGREVRRDTAEDLADDAAEREQNAKLQLALDKLASIEDKVDDLPDPVPPTENPQP